MGNYKLYTTYALVPTGTTAIYKQALHCNYINSIDVTTDNIYIYEIKFNFENISDLKFLSDDINNGTGYTVHNIYLLVQIVDTDIDENPKSTDWKIYDVTTQINGYVPGQFLSASGLTGVVFKAPLNIYNTKSNYTLDYLNYPSSNDENTLCLGDETYFFGNVETSIRADVYTTDISINLPLNEFNSSTNLTWDGLSTVYISEIGIYNSDKVLVAIGKLNNPIPKDTTISRTIVFDIDF